MKVFVYYNLHRHCWSVKSLEGRTKGRVIAHEQSLILTNATPKVSQKGRERVLREKRKNVHAGIVGEWLPFVKYNTTGYVEAPLTYNPYKSGSFHYALDGEKFTHARMVSFGDRKVNQIF